MAQSMEKIFNNIEDTGWKNNAIRAIKQMAARGVPFQAADLRDLGVMDGPNPAHFGAVFAAARRMGLIEVHSYGPSRHENAKGGLVRIWIGVKQDDSEPSES